jgi:acid phosphatase type 7
MINSFEDAKVWLFEGTIEKFTAMASTPVLTFTDLDAPLRGHIHRTADPSQMRVLWNSRNNNENAAVKWGASPGAYSGVAYAESATYAASDLCGDPAQTHGWFTPHYWNNALMTGLKPSTVYYYVYGSDANGWSAEASFVSAPAPGPNQAVNILACADMGMTNPDATLSHWNEPSAGLTTQHMAAEALSGDGYSYSLLLHSGDISYATGYQLKWDLFASEITATGLGLRVPYMLNQGAYTIWVLSSGCCPGRWRYM